MSLENLHYGQSFRHAAATPLSSLVINLELAQEHRHIAKTPYVQQALCSAYRLKELFQKPQLLKSKRSFSPTPSPPTQPSTLILIFLTKQNYMVVDFTFKKPLSVP